MTQAASKHEISLPDDALVRRVRKGELQAFNLLVLRYQNRVFSMVHRIVGIPSETEDLAQEIFVTLYRSLHSFRGDCAFSTWLYRITVNQCKNRLKFLQRRNFHRAQDIDDTPEKNFESARSMAFADPEQQLMGRQMESLIQTELANLEEDFRIILILRDIEHLSYDAIAEITSLPLGTVKSRLHRARALLKARLEPYLK
jgi:RNA polymerase sigma-70 factor (ECF subfamily)